jgi:hypothetical protein
MASGFDAYHKWLSIPPKEQPPNHYRLLGLGLYEDDPDVISAAADRQMSHVQTYKNGPHSAESQKLLNEIAAAKLCLLKPAKRAAYDAELRQHQTADQPKFTPAASTFTGPAPAATANTTARSTTSATAAVGHSNGAPLPPPPLAAPPRIDDLDGADDRIPAFGTRTLVVLGSLLILLLVVAIVIVAKSGWNSGSSSPNGTTKSGDGGLADGTNQTGKASDATTFSTRPSVETTTTTIPPSSLSVNPEEKPSVTKSVTPTAASTSTNTTAATTDPVKKPEVPPTVPSPASTSITSANPLANANPPAAATNNASPKKLLVPDAMAAAAVESRIAEMFAGAQPEAILEQSKPLTDGPLVYVALNKALGTATSSGNAALAGRIVDELSRRFRIETVPLRTKAYLDLRQHITTIPDWHGLGEAALAAIDEAVAVNRADLALSLAESSLLAARKSGNLDLIRKVTLRVLELQGQSAAKPDSAKPDTAKPPATAPNTKGPDAA